MKYMFFTCTSLHSHIVFWSLITFIPWAIFIIIFFAVMLNSSHATIFTNWMSLRLIVRFSRFVCYMNFDVEVDLNVSMCNYTHRSLLQCVNIIDWLWLNSFQLAKYNLQIAIWLMLEFSVAILFVWKCVCSAFKWVQISMFEFCKR